MWIIALLTVALVVLFLVFRRPFNPYKYVLIALIGLLTLVTGGQAFCLGGEVLFSDFTLWDFANFRSWKIVYSSCAEDGNEITLFIFLLLAILATLGIYAQHNK